MSRSTPSVLGPMRRCAIVLRGQKRCAWCCRKLARDTVQIDHVVPRSEGGSHALDNLVPSCGDCNLARQEGDDAFRVHLSEHNTKLEVAMRRVRHQLVEPVDLHRGKQLAMRWYAWFAGWLERNREAQRRRDARRLPKTARLPHVGMVGEGFPLVPWATVGTKPPHEHVTRIQGDARVTS